MRDAHQTIRRQSPQIRGRLGRQAGKPRSGAQPEVWHVEGRILSRPRKQAAGQPEPATVDQTVLDRLAEIEARLAEAATADGVARALKYYDDEVVRPRLSSIKAGLPRRRKA